MAGFVGSRLWPTTTPVWAITILAGTALVLLLWGQPGRVRLTGSVAGLVACGLLLIVGTLRTSQQVPIAAQAVAFEMVRVDDEADLFNPWDNPPAGASVEYEIVDGRNVQLLRVSGASGISLEQLRRRGDEWLTRHALAGGDVRAAWGREYDQPGMVIRSYRIRGPAFITSADVVSSHVESLDNRTEFQIAVTLNPEAGKRLQDVTRSHIDKRLAIMLDGMVHVAPVVRGEIGSGKVSITLGKNTTRLEAEGLAAGLRGDLLRAR